MSGRRKDSRRIAGSLLVSRPRNGLLNVDVERSQRRSVLRCCRFVLDPYAVSSTTKRIITILDLRVSILHEGLLNGNRKLKTNVRRAPLGAWLDDAVAVCFPSWRSNVLRLRRFRDRQRCLTTHIIICSALDSFMSHDGFAEKPEVLFATNFYLMK